MQLSSTPGSPLIIQISYDASNNIEYVGYASPGSETSDAVWKIFNLIYDASDNIVQVIFCEGNTTFDKIWDNRADYTYS